MLVAIVAILAAGCGSDPTATDAEVDDSSASSRVEPTPTSADAGAGPTEATQTEATQTETPQPEADEPPGSQSPTSSPGRAAPQSGPLAGDAAGEISLNVVGEGSTVKLAEVAAADRPTLLWFWAPH